MILLERLRRWQAEAKISSEQFALLASLERRERFSLFAELNALLYLGVLFFIGGLGWTVRTYFSQLGDVAIITGLITLFLACLGYAFYKAPPFSRTEVPSTNMAFDYVVYLGCLVFSVLLGYLEYRFKWLGAQWDLYLLAASLLFFFLAYRFDNRFVLSLALSTLAVWFGVKFSFRSLLRVDDLRPYALLYGVSVGALGGGLAWAGWKAHFRDTYWHVAGNILMMAAMSGIADKQASPLWVVLLLTVAITLFMYGQRTKQFSFVAYSVLYAYVGVTWAVLRQIPQLYMWWPFVYFYFLISGLLVIGGLVMVSHRFSK